VFEFANAMFLQLIGNRDIIGKPLREALPEADTKEYFDLLDQIVAADEPYTGKEVKVEMGHSEDGTPIENYFNFVYQPAHDAEGKVDGILVHAVDVTEQVIAREDSRRSQQRLEIAQQAGHIGTFEWNVKTNHVLWTPELEALYGLPPGGFRGRYEDWARRVHPDDLQGAEESLQGSVTGGPPYNAEFRVIWPDGTVHWMLAKGDISSYDEEGHPLTVIGINIDITERKQSEEEITRINQELQNLNANLETMVAQRTSALNQSNTDLQRSNQELQEFAYVASHDLQEPLRKIQAFGNLLQEEYGEAINGGKAYLDRMRNAAARMQVLINDLLVFSRVTTKAQPFTSVNLKLVAIEVVDDLEAKIQATHGTVEVGELPTIDADPLQMRQMLQNLISNALKFQRRDIPPVVKIRADMVSIGEEPGDLQTETGGPEKADQLYCRLFVEDNGIGFDEKYLDRIFTVFQRLHGRSDYEGTGIGLAVVRKIVERHGGTITARSTPGQGSTFIVTLPAHTSSKGEEIEEEKNLGE
jgi:PAS domain S-box-containing protein